MKQIPLILWKDMRQLWPQLSLYAVLLAAYTWAVPQTWPGSVPNSFLSGFVTLLTALYGLSQFVLITSAVHVLDTTLCRHSVQQNAAGVGVTTA